ncbi:MAG: hypothetical protein VX768_06580 [Planctomycetota bacterium]|nr:hypothetical protein [Planctomycetota bacterium]
MNEVYAVSILRCNLAIDQVGCFVGSQFGRIRFTEQKNRVDKIGLAQKKQQQNQQVKPAC